MSIAQNNNNNLPKLHLRTGSWGNFVRQFNQDESSQLNNQNIIDIIDQTKLANDDFLALNKNSYNGSEL